MKESILSNLCRSGCRVTLISGTQAPLTITGRIETDPRGFEYGFIVADSTRRLVVSFTHEEVTELVLSINGNHDDPVVRILLSDAE